MQFKNKTTGVIFVITNPDHLAYVQKDSNFEEVEAVEPEKEIEKEKKPPRKKA